MNQETLYRDGKFVGPYGSSEHKAHIARVQHLQEVYDVIESLCTLGDPDALIEDRATHARYLESSKETFPEAYAEGVAMYQEKAGALGVLRARPRPPFSPLDSRIGDILTTPPVAPPFVVDRLLPRAHGVENAIGGAGKTTRHIWEAAHIILARPLYGREVLQPGAVLVVTKEDDLPLFRHRIRGVLDGMPDLSAADRKRVVENLHVLVLTGTDERLASPARDGKILQTDLPERIIAGYEHEGLALVEFDPFNMFGPGERFVNDGEAATLSAMARMAQSLKCAVRATAHISKFVHREGISDAHSGRGGSAAGDNARFVWNYLKHDPVRDKGAIVPAECAAAAEAGNLYRLDVPKVTATRPAFDSVWVTRRGFAFDWQANLAVTPTERRKAAADADAVKVWHYLRAEHEKAECFTLKALEAESAILGIGQKRIRDAVHRLTEQGRLVEADLPKSLQKGARKTYLQPIEPPPAALDTNRPIAEQMT